MTETAPLTIPVPFPAPLVALTPEVLSAVQAAQDALQAVPAAITAETLPAADAALLGARAQLKAIEHARTEVKAHVRALGKAIDDACKGAAQPLQEAVQAVQGRVGAWMRAEEARRQEEAREAARKAEEERAAREKSEAEAKAAREALAAGEELDLAPEDFEPAATPPELLEPPRAPEPAVRSQAVTTRRMPVLVIDDAEKVPVYLRNEGETIELRPIADGTLKRALLAGWKVPGAHLDYEDVPVGRGLR